MGNAVIFSGVSVKALKQNLNLNGVVTVGSGSTDPSSSGFTAPVGSIYLRTNGSLYVKIGVSDTSWSPALIAGSPASFSDANFELTDDSDSTKKLKFQLSGISPDTTRTLTVPDIDGTIAAGEYRAGEVIFWESTGSSANQIDSEPALSPSRGGTGKQNDPASTITITGAFPLTVTLTNSTFVTFPSSGTLSTLAGSENITNKSISSSNADLTRLLITAGSGSADGFIQLGRQSAPPIPPLESVRIYNDNDDQLSWMLPDGFTRKISSSLTESRTWILPDFSGTVVLLERDQTFSAVQTFSSVPVFQAGLSLGNPNTVSLVPALTIVPYSLEIPGSAPTSVSETLTYTGGTTPFVLAWKQPGELAFLAGEAIAANDVLYVAMSSDSGRTAGRVYKAEVSDPLRSMIVGVAIAAQGTVGGVVRVQTVGSKSGFSETGVVGQTAYLSSTTPGAVSTDVSSVIVGIFTAPGTIALNLNPPLVDTGVTSVGSLDSQTPSFDGAVISGSTIFFQSASETNPGLVSTVAQTFGGDKTFSGSVTISGLEGVVKSSSGTLSASSIVDADIASSAGIQFSKMEALDAEKAVITNASGEIVAALATADEVNYLSGVTSSIQDQLDAKLNLSGGIMSGALDMGEFKITNLAAPEDATDAVNKAYVDAFISGLTWLNPIDDPDLVADDLSTPPTSPIPNVTYLVSNNPTGDWATLAGHLVYFDFDTSTWVDVLGRPVAVGERFGITMVHGEGSESGNMFGRGNQIAELTNATPGSYAYVFITPSEGQAVFVSEAGSQHFGKSYVYTDASDWILFSGPTAVDAGMGLQWDGNLLNVNLGAGITELPADAVGIDVFSDGGLFLTEDGVTSSTDSAAKLSIKLDGTTLSRSSSGLKIADGGIGDDQISALAGISRSKVAAGTANHVVINGVDGFLSSEAALSPTRGGTGVQNDAASTITISGAYPLTAILTGSTSLTFPTIGTLANTIYVDAADTLVSTAAQNAIVAEADARIAEDEILSGRIDALEGVVDLMFPNNTGSTILAGSMLILSQTVSGEIALADASQISTCEGIVGVAVSDILDTESGKVRVAGQVTVRADTSLDLGKRVYVSGINPGQVSKNAPTAANSVVFLVGHASATDKVVLNMQLVAINE